MRCRGVIALALVFVGAVFAGPAAPARTGSLLYLRPLGGNAPPWGRLFVAAADGSGARDVTPTGLVDVQGAAWSPNGRRIALSAIADGDHDPELFTSRPDGSDLRRVTNNHLSDRQPSWSPDGRRLVFSSARTGLFQIYSIRVDGSGLRRLSNQAEDCETPSWSPNGRWIVCSCQLGFWKLVLMRPDGSGQRRLLRGYPLTESSPTWTPNNSIVFARGASTAAGRGLFVVRADGSGLRRLRSHGGDPAVSPDGRLIAFTWTPDGVNQELFVSGRDGTAPRQITATNGIIEWNPHWQPIR